MAFFKRKNTKPSPISVPSPQKGALYAPMKGKVLPVEQADDPMFASKAMGDGLVFIPADGVVYAPFDGEVIMTFPTKHALGLRSKEGTEILIHVGMDTVSLDGKPFDLYVESGQKISAGEPLLKADLKAIEKAGLSTQTPVILTNKEPFVIENQGDVEPGQLVLSVK